MELFCSHSSLKTVSPNADVFLHVVYDIVGKAYVSIGLFELEKKIRVSTHISEIISYDNGHAQFSFWIPTALAKGWFPYDRR